MIYKRQHHHQQPSSAPGYRHFFVAPYFIAFSHLHSIRKRTVECWKYHYIFVIRIRRYQNKSHTISLFCLCAALDFITNRQRRYSNKQKKLNWNRQNYIVVVRYSCCFVQVLFLLVISVWISHRSKIDSPLDIWSFFICNFYKDKFGQIST